MQMDQWFPHKLASRKNEKIFRGMVRPADILIEMIYNILKIQVA
jgi:hypothetical protein